jgi:hypothetical protein
MGLCPRDAIMKGKTPYSESGSEVGFEVSIQKSEIVLTTMRLLVFYSATKLSSEQIAISSLLSCP